MKAARLHRVAGPGDLEITEADPVLRGGTAAPSYKSATLENGLKIQVPPFIEAGTEWWSTPKTAPMCGARNYGLSVAGPECDDRRRPQGRPGRWCAISANWKISRSR